MKVKKGDTILCELKRHFPFTLISSLTAGVLVAIFYLTNRRYFVGVVSGLFEVMHPAHVLVSAMATSAIYWKYNKSVVKTILIGVVGAILIGSLSDILFPWIAGNLFSLHTHFHLPIIEKPILIIGVALVGSVAGMHFMFRVSHSIHVFLSVFASLFYLLVFSIEVSALAILLISLLVFLAVYIPCCISDIVFPLLFVRKLKG
ncbi:hypothetical protein KAJ38_01750 [Candidatus Pacearchaeota archaeon]|nr:hypothetical protein [Candidatus Pacearchaeota archaeon]